MNKLLKSLVMAAVLLTTAAAQGEPDQTAQTIFKKLMAATISDDYDGFVAECDATMKAAISKPVLEGVSKQIEPRTKSGYDAEYLGELKQRGFAVHLWKLHFKDGGDDFLATLSIKDGKAGGFYLH